MYFIRILSVSHNFWQCCIVTQKIGQEISKLSTDTVCNIPNKLIKITANFVIAHLDIDVPFFCWSSWLANLNCIFLGFLQNIPLVSELLEASESGCSKCDILKMEKIILKTLKWKIHTPTPLTFLHHVSLTENGSTNLEFCFN